MSAELSPPRLVVAGLAGDSGKTVVSLGLALAAAGRGVAVRAFKKGPDYIDAAWLRWATGHPARNLDTWMMGFDVARDSFVRHAAEKGLNLIEGNRGLYDGADAAGTHSTAELAKTLRAPVVLVLPVTKVTRTAAAYVLGCQKLDPDVSIAGVVLNRVATSRQENVIREAIESECGVPVLGALPRARGQDLLPGRHLGLVTPEEHPGIGDVRANVLGLVEAGLDVGRLLDIARSAPPLPAPGPLLPGCGGAGLAIGCLQDSAFTFYYPENLEALEAAGARLVPVSSLEADRLPRSLDALYIGGGFPETHGAALAANAQFLADLRRRAAGGLPVYAECGGLMLLARAIRWREARYPMAGVLPFDVEIRPEPQGHGYAELEVDEPNPYYPVGLRLRGHEFHYSRVAAGGGPLASACRVRRGAGCHDRRDGVVAGNVWASYTHVHALATPEWAAGFLAAARAGRTG